MRQMSSGIGINHELRKLSAACTLASDDDARPHGREAELPNAKLVKDAPGNSMRLLF